MQQSSLEFFNRIFGVRKYSHAEKLKHNLRVFSKERAQDDDDQLDEDNEERDEEAEDTAESVKSLRHKVSDLADLLSEATGGKWTRAKCLHHLMTHPDGAAMVSRLNKALANRKDRPTMGKMETLEKFVKSRDGNMLLICKHIVDGGEVSLSEAAFTKLATDAAQLVYKNDRPDKAFSRYFQGNEIVRRAHAITKGTLMPILPVRVGGASAVDAADDDPSDALAQIEELVARMRAAQPALSKAQAFAKVYCDPANAHLAAAERRQNRPRA